MNRDFDEYEPPAIGTRFDVGTTCIEYAGEYYFDYWYPTDDDEADFCLLNRETRQPFSLVLSDFLRIVSPSPLKDAYHGIWHGTINSGYLIRTTNDGEGAFLFRHWGA